mgnify:CR=1 FL=1|tara:strand:- start:1550 stop:2518 length:969 start_codon:yes stop_codon:yes gene_type:complete
MYKNLKENLILRTLYNLILKIFLIFLAPLKYLKNLANQFFIFRTLSFYLYPNNKLIFCNVDELNFIVNTNDYVNSKKIFINKSFPQFKEFCKALEILKNRNYEVNSLVEVGSHYGNIVVPAVKKFNLIKAYAFEPIKENFEILKMNLYINQINETVIAKELFVSDVTENIEMYTFNNNSAAALNTNNLNLSTKNMYTSINSLSESTLASVKTTKLNDEIDHKELDQPIYWLYAQGSEYNIINGSKNLFQNSPPLIIAYSPLLYKSKDIDSEKFYSLLKALGYQNFIDLHSSENKIFSLSKQYLSLLDSRLTKTSSIRLLLFI